MRSVRFSLAMLLVACVLLGSVSVRPFEGLWAPWRLAVLWKQTHYRPAYDSNCMESLGAEFLTENYSFAQEPSDREKGCVIDTPLIMLSGPLPYHAIDADQWQAELVMSCRLASQMRDFTKEILIPQAKALLGVAPRAILHAGSYRCHGEDALSSGHGFGEAIDFAGIELPGGRVITVKAHLLLTSPEGQYLRRVATAACHRFGTVLGPRFHANYADHLHLAFGFPGRCVF